MNQVLLNKEVQSFINAKIKEDPAKLILKGSPFQNIKIQEIVSQIVAKKKCEKKLPSWYKNNLIYYPNKLNIEQSSSEITAKYKAGLISGNSLIDITGGFGVDCHAFAEKFKEITYCEINDILSKIVQYNFVQLKVKPIKVLNVDGLTYLKNKIYDWIYADPSRRNEIKGKVFLLNDCLPNIPDNIYFLFEHANNILLKLSPLLDLKASIHALKFIKEIHVIAVKNEVKELLFILQKNYNGPINIHTVNIKKEDIESLNSQINSSVKSIYSLPKKYLYEPNNAILKAGLFNEVSHQLNIYKLHNNSHLYTSNELIKFPGRKFKIVHIINYDIKKLKKIISSKKANITIRNFPDTVAHIRKKTGLKDGGKSYLFFTTNLENKRIVIICEKVNY